MENLPILQDFVPYRCRCPKRLLLKKAYLKNTVTTTTSKTSNTSTRVSGEDPLTYPKGPFSKERVKGGWW